MSNPTVPVFTPEQIAGGEVSGPAATCSACDGTGRVPLVYPIDNEALALAMAPECKSCDGTGEAISSSSSGGDFRAEVGTSGPCPGTYGNEESPCGRRAGHGGDCGPASMDRARRAAHRGA